MDVSNFEVKDDKITPVCDFLNQVELKVKERGDIPSEKERLHVIRDKILEKVRLKKICRDQSRERSLSSSSRKRVSADSHNGEHKSRRTGYESSLALH